MTSAQLINQTSGEVEYYTPHAIAAAARRTMGVIDLDPTSTADANKVVQARKFFTLEDDAMKQGWLGRVWLNWPFGRAEDPCPADCALDHVHHSYRIYSNNEWCSKLLEEVASRRTHEACCITYACTSEKWFQPLLKQPQCFLYPRTNYLLPDGSVKRGVTKGSVVTYFGPNESRFALAFEELGTVKR